MYHPLVPRIHTLVDLVYDAERRARERLERHQVENGRDGALAAGLTVCVEDLKCFVFAGLVSVVEWDEARDCVGLTEI